ncbi:hypothetical protein C8F01DRAFT_1373792 [Mycena amicta]|nr:hypothetical protein C8F01DRAFT_1373792 [Mycena amicta]
MHFFASIISSVTFFLAVLSPTQAASGAIALHHPAPLPVATLACNSTTKICFQLYSGTYMTLGFALPPAHSEFSNEMMIFSVSVATSFPLPYGYVGAVPGIFQDANDVDSGSPASGSAPPFHILSWWIDSHNNRREESYSPSSKTGTLIAESAIQKPAINGAAALFPLAAATIKTSPVVSGNATHAVHIFRCQQCTSLTTYFASGPVVNMSMIYSRSAPEPVGGMGLAVLPLANSETEGFQMVVKHAEFADYEEMLKAAQII